MASLLGAALLMFLLAGLTPAKDAPRIWVMLGGRMPEGLIQGVTYFLFIWGIAVIVSLRMRLSREKEALAANLLPEKENYILSADDAGELKLRMQQIERTGKYYLTDLIKKACTKYRLGKSSSEALGLVETQIGLYSAEIESEQAFINYIAWAIPSVGFIGTVLGIAASLGYAKDASTPEGIEKVTDMLAVAFDTTFVALILSIVLMLLIHTLHKQQDELFTSLKEYTIENLINRFYK